MSQELSRLNKNSQKSVDLLKNPYYKIKDPHRNARTDRSREQKRINVIEASESRQFSDHKSHDLLKSQEAELSPYRSLPKSHSMVGINAFFLRPSSS
jgi:hypothetical protein